jgi:predicted ArsR family transcriptional regulator
VPNAIARDARLSFRARGLLVMLLSLPPEWHVTADTLAEDNPDSRTAIRSAMRELRESGYVELHKVRGSDGRTRSHHEVFDTDPANRVLSASGATCGNNASPQVAPEAEKPPADIAAECQATGVLVLDPAPKGGKR